MRSRATRACSISPPRSAASAPPPTPSPIRPRLHFKHATLPTRPVSSRDSRLLPCCMGSPGGRRRALPPPFPHGSLLRAQVSRDAPPPLPGGYKVGEKTFFTGANETFPTGDKVVHGQQGEVVGPATPRTKGKGVKVRFPATRAGSIALTMVRFSAASTIPLPVPRSRDAAHVSARDSPCWCARPSLHEQPPAPQPTARVREGTEGGLGRGAGWPLPWQSQRGRRWSPTSLWLVVACAGEPRPAAAAAAGRLQGGREGVLHGGEPDLSERQQARARPAGRGGGARHSRDPQGQGRGGALPRQHALGRLLSHHGPAPPRRSAATRPRGPRDAACDAPRGPSSSIPTPTAASHCVATAGEGQPGTSPTLPFLNARR